jgi:sialate O-acetylesterase
VQIGRHISDANVAEWNQIQTDQLKAESELRHAAMVASIDCTMDDPIHISTEGLKRLGHRLADRVCHDLFPNLKNYGELQTGPKPESVRYDTGVVKVEFTGVNGRLESDGRVGGFSIHDEKGGEVPLIYKASIDPAHPNTVLLYIGSKLPEKATVWYGAGTDPYCNLRDASDQAAPVFGPFAIQ